MKKEKYYVVINNAKPDTWSEWVWKDISDEAQIFLDNNILKSEILKKIKKLHFSNRINKIIDLPLKSIWDSSLCIKKDQLDSRFRNYVIFQNTVKFSPSYVKKLKEEKNVCVVLYLYDTIEKMGIGNTKKEFEDYCKRYHIDYVYSFDQHDVELVGAEYFDLYSSYNLDVESDKSQGVFYVGSCRSKGRLKDLHSIYMHLYEKYPINFYIVGVNEEDKIADTSIRYNESLKYSEVLRKIGSNDCLLEINNADQTGYTVRFKEAICYNKKLITNNKEVKNSPYYNPDYIYVYDAPQDIDYDWLTRKVIVNYNYKGDFSPRTLLKMITMKDEKTRNESMVGN